MSVWNSAGTWEEKDMSAWMNGKLKQLLVGLQAQADNGVAVESTKVVKCEGEARVLNVRGKKRAGFEYQLEVSWKATVSGSSEKKGSILFDDVSETSIDDLEMRVTVQGAADAHADQAKRAALSLRPQFQKIFQDLIAEALGGPVS
eukprot:m.48023 g.48023  ORF g.48023 m.48023 type:complete len:146 (-) comp12692_c0_seq2:199-636(-)